MKRNIVLRVVLLVAAVIAFAAVLTGLNWAAQYAGRQQVVDDSSTQAEPQPVPCSFELVAGHELVPAATDRPVSGFDRSRGQVYVRSDTAVIMHLPGYEPALVVMPSSYSGDTQVTDITYQVAYYGQCDPKYFTQMERVRVFHPESISHPNPWFIFKWRQYVNHPALMFWPDGSMG